VAAQQDWQRVSRISRLPITAGLLARGVSVQAHFRFGSGVTRCQRSTDETAAFVERVILAASWPDDECELEYVVGDSRADCSLVFCGRIESPG
jgi:hypothetical protein